MLPGFTPIRYLEAVAECEKKVREELGDHVSAARSQPYYLDVTHPAANKGSVVDFLACVYLIPKSSIATLGDMPNDVLMFKKSGMSIAIGNSSKEVQAAPFNDCLSALDSYKGRRNPGDKGNEGDNTERLGGSGSRCHRDEEQSKGDSDRSDEIQLYRSQCKVLVRI